MNKTELNEYTDRLIIMAADIASKETITPDDRVRLKAINQGEKLIKQALNKIKIEQIISHIDDLELQMAEMDQLIFKGE